MLSTFMSLPFGLTVGALFDGTVIPLVSGFGLASAAAFAVMAWTERTLWPAGE